MTTTLTRKKSLLARVKAWLAPPRDVRRPPTRLLARPPVPSSKMISEIFDLPLGSTPANPSPTDRKV